MSRLKVLRSLAGVVAFAAASMASAGGALADTAILYQGQLSQSGAAVDGACDFIFSLWNAQTSGDNIGPVLQVNALPVEDGVFTVPLDFGVAAFTGEARWLQVAVRCPAGSGPFFTLTPRQRLTGAPYTLLALNQSTLAAADGDPAPAVVVDEEGQVGIGTDAPTAPLAVNGLIHSLAGGLMLPDGTVLTSIDEFVQEVTAGQGLSGGGLGPVLQLDVALAGTGSATTVSRSDHWHNSLAASDGSPSSAVTVDAGGAVGIGTGAPAAKLDVVALGDGAQVLRLSTERAWVFEQQGSGGNADLVLRSTVGSKAFMIQGADGDVVANFETHSNLGLRSVTLVPGGGRVGVGGDDPGFTFFVNGSAGKPGGGPWASSSDRRLKQNIQPLQGALERVLALSGVTYEWRRPEEHGNLTGTQIGMIAQDVEAVFPDWVEEDLDGVKVLSIRGFEALTVEALRELRAEKDAEIALRDDRITELQDAVAMQQSLINDLAARLAALEAGEEGANP